MDAATPDLSTLAPAQSTAAALPMKAILQGAYGGVEVFRLGDAPRPTPGPGEVLVEVHAAGLDRGTWHLMAGKPYLMRLMGYGFSRPNNPVPGLDVAGRVVALGEGVRRFAVGDEVFGMSRGSFAEYACAREDKLAHKPAGLSFAQAAVMGVSATTALQGLRDAGKLQPGQRVLVLGASGGVGSYAVQLARALGAAEVTGVCSAAKAGLVRALGADRVLDHATQDFAAEAGRYELILDTGGNASLARLRRALTPTGTVVLVGAEGAGDWTGMGRVLRSQLLQPFTTQRFPMLVNKEHFADLEVLARLAAEGKVRPALERTFPLDQAPAAMAHLVAGQVRGKVGIAVRG